MDDLTIIILIVVVCVSTLAGWLIAVACCPDKTMACMGNGQKRSIIYRDGLRHGEREVNREMRGDIRRDSEVEENTTSRTEEEASKCDIEKGSTIYQTGTSKKTDLSSMPLLETSAISLSSISDHDSHSIKPHLVKQREDTDVIEYVIVDRDDYDVSSDSATKLSSHNSNDEDSFKIIEGSSSNTVEEESYKPPYPFKFQNHHLSLIQYDQSRRGSLPSSEDIQKLRAITQESVKAV
uniref:Uncharacterized protein n=1 Tax=Rhabditophanes sp. KR3021 TaxID=114890 RepID=A0AC35TWD7_9BILA